MKPNCTELAAQYERGEITFDEFMNTATAPEKYVVPQTKRRGRRLAQRQGQLVTPAAPEPEIPSRITDPKDNGSCDPTAEQRMDAADVEAVRDPLYQDYIDASKPEVGPGNLKTAAAALAFITAGNAYFTIRSQKTGTRYTYRVSRAKPNAGYCQWCKAEPCRCVPPYFVSLLSGPENTSDYTYLGMVRENLFRLTRASKMNETSLPVRAFRWVWEHLVRRELPPQTEIWHEGRCGRCGRMLTVPESVAAGIGPECAGRMGL